MRECAQVFSRFAVAVVSLALELGLAVEVASVAVQVEVAKPDLHHSHSMFRPDCLLGSAPVASAGC